jgi:hypothetical protein
MTVFALIASLAFAGLMIWVGVFYIVQQHTGLRTTATVGDCEVTGSGRYMETHCNGTWIVGGPLLDGGHVVYGEIDDADPKQVGHDIPVTVHGDTAYTLDPILPTMVIAFGVVWLGAAVVLARRLVRGPQRPATSSVR